jgi:preprotein translocase subunit YajC
MLTLAALVAATSKTTTSGGSAASLLFIVIIGLAAYFLFIRPRSQAARRQRETLMELTPGDEVLTGAGIFGTVLDVEDDRVTIETAPGTRMTVLRSTSARRITQSEEPELPPSWDDEEHEGVGGPSGGAGTSEGYDDKDGGGDAPGAEGGATS